MVWAGCGLGGAEVAGGVASAAWVASVVEVAASVVEVAASVVEVAASAASVARFVEVAASVVEVAASAASVASVVEVAASVVEVAASAASVASVVEVAETERLVIREEDTCGFVAGGGRADAETDGDAGVGDGGGVLGGDEGRHLRNSE